MAERRAIKSTIWSDTWFGRLSPFEMVVWIGLFSKCADDQGRMQDDPALIRSQIFPYQDITLKAVSEALDTFGDRLIRYTKGEPLAQILRWWDNQPMQYATPSDYPPPEGWKDRYRANYKKHYIVFNWNGVADTEIGLLLWDGLSKLARQTSWTAYLGALNFNFNFNLNFNQLNNNNNISENLEKNMQHLIEEMTGYPAMPMDLPAIDEFVKMGVTKEDIAGALAFFKGNGKVAHGAQNLLNSVKFQVARRIQSANAKDTQTPTGIHYEEMK